MSTTAETGNDTVVKQAKGAKASRAKDLGIVADADGVAVSQVKGGDIAVRFVFNQAMMAEIRKIDGAKFDRDQEAWIVPGDKVEQLKPVIDAMRKEFVRDSDARADIEHIAKTAAMAMQKENGTAAGVQPKISDYIAVGENSLGVIVAVNGRYAAQLTGFGKGDGAGFVTIHDLSALDEQVFKGDRVSIGYKENTRSADVKHVKTKEERDQEFASSLGKNVDGVRVVETDGKYSVEFDYNPAVTERIQRIDGAEFDKGAKVWTVGGDKKDFLVRAVSDMRREVVADRSDRAALEEVAQTKIDGAKIKDAFTKDGTATTGQVLARNSRYVLQHSGKEYVALHRVGAFESTPNVGANARIEYQGGKAKVTDKSLAKSQGNER